VGSIGITTNRFSLILSGAMISLFGCGTGNQGNEQENQEVEPESAYVEPLTIEPVVEQPSAEPVEPQEPRVLSDFEKLSEHQYEISFRSEGRWFEIDLQSDAVIAGYPVLAGVVIFDWNGRLIWFRASESFLFDGHEVLEGDEVLIDPEPMTPPADT